LTGQDKIALAVGKVINRRGDAPPQGADARCLNHF
jgi:hypothetical protein